MTLTPSELMASTYTPKTKTTIKVKEVPPELIPELLNRWTDERHLPTRSCLYCGGTITDPEARAAGWFSAECSNQGVTFSDYATDRDTYRNLVVPWKLISDLVEQRDLGFSAISLWASDG